MASFKLGRIWVKVLHMVVVKLKSQRDKAFEVWKRRETMSKP